MLVGGYSGFANYYRFAAADAASPEFRSRAISWVVAGGVVAAFAGTNIVRWTQGLGSTPFLATYLALALLSVAALFVISRLSLPPAAADHVSGPGRPLREIIRQPRLHHRAHLLHRGFLDDGHGDDGHSACHADVRLRCR